MCFYENCHNIQHLYFLIAARGQNLTSEADVPSSIPKENNGMTQFLEKLKLLNSRSLQETSNSTSLNDQDSLKVSLNTSTERKLDNNTLQEIMAKPLVDLLQRLTKFQKKIKNMGKSITKRSVDMKPPRLRLFPTNSEIVGEQEKENPPHRDQMRYQALIQSTNSESPTKNQLLSKVQIKSLNQENQSQIRDQLKQSKRTVQNDKEVVKRQIKLASHITASGVQRPWIEKNVQSQIRFQSKDQAQAKRNKGMISKIPLQDFKSNLSKIQLLGPHLNQTQHSTSTRIQLISLSENERHSPLDVANLVSPAKATGLLTDARKRISFLTSSSALKKQRNSSDLLTEPTDLFRKYTETSQPFQKLTILSSLLPRKNRMQKRKMIRNRISAKQQQKSFLDMRLYQSVALIRPRLQTRNVVTEQIPTSLAQAYIHPGSPVVTSSKSNTKGSKLKGQKIKLQMKKKEPKQQNYMKSHQTRKWQHAPSPLQQQNQQFVDVRLREEQLPESHLENGLLMKPPNSAILTLKSVGKLQTTNDLTKVQSAKAVPLKVFLFPNKIPSMPVRHSHALKAKDSKNMKVKCHN